MPPPTSPAHRSDTRKVVVAVAVMLTGFAIGGAYFLAILTSGEVRHEEILLEPEPSRARRKREVVIEMIDFGVELRAADAPISVLMLRDVERGFDTGQRIELTLRAPDGADTDCSSYVEGGNSRTSLLVLEEVTDGTHRFVGSVKRSSGTTRLSLEVRARALILPIWIVFAGVLLVIGGGIAMAVTLASRSLRTYRELRRAQPPPA